MQSDADPTPRAGYDELLDKRPIVPVERGGQVVLVDDPQPRDEETAGEIDVLGEIELDEELFHAEFATRCATFHPRILQFHLAQETDAAVEAMPQEEHVACEVRLSGAELLVVGHLQFPVFAHQRRPVAGYQTGVQTVCLCKHLGPCGVQQQQSDRNGKGSHSGCEATAGHPGVECRN